MPTLQDLPAWVSEAATLYASGRSCRSIGAELGKAWSGVNYHLKRLGLTRPRPFKSKVIYKGDEYTLCPSGYLRASKRSVRLDVARCYLHRRVWIEMFGEIPSGMEVHHRNFDKEDNRPENLELLSISAHAEIHAGEHRFVRSL